MWEPRVSGGNNRNCLSLAIVTDQVYIYLGGPNGLASTPATTLKGPLGDTPGFFSNPPTAANRIGNCSACSPALPGADCSACSGYVSCSVALNNVAPAGDVNGDGYADVLVSNRKQETFLFYGTASGVDTNGTKLPTGHSDMGASGAGDVNGDGYADVVIGNLPSGQPPMVYLGSASGLVLTPSFLPAPRPGVLVYAAADFNGDGYADIVGIDYAVNTGDPFVYMFFGSSTGIAATPSVLNATGASEGITPGDFGVGDFNGDGYSDAALLMGVWPSSANGLLTHGSVSGLTALTASFAPVANTVSDTNWLWGAGDLNGDGFEDLITRGDVVSPNPGAGFYLGGPSGISGSPLPLSLPSNLLSSAAPPYAIGAAACGM